MPCHSLCLNQEQGYQQLPYGLLASIPCQTSFVHLWSTDLALPYMKKKGSVPIVKQDLWIHSVIMLLHVMSGAIWFRCCMSWAGRNFFRLQRCQPVTNLRAEKPYTRNKFLNLRCVFTLWVCWATVSSGYNHYLPTSAQYFFQMRRGGLVLPWELQKTGS